PRSLARPGPSPWLRPGRPGCSARPQWSNETSPSLRPTRVVRIGLGEPLEDDLGCLEAFERFLGVAEHVLKSADLHVRRAYPTLPARLVGSGPDQLLVDCAGGALRSDAPAKSPCIIRALPIAPCAPLRLRCTSTLSGSSFTRRSAISKPARKRIKAAAA